jgi:hypothetical protein
MLGIIGKSVILHTSTEQDTLLSTSSVMLRVSFLLPGSREIKHFQLWPNIGKKLLIFDIFIISLFEDTNVVNIFYNVIKLKERSLRTKILGDFLLGIEGVLLDWARYITSTAHKHRPAKNWSRISIDSYKPCPWRGPRSWHPRASRTVPRPRGSATPHPRPLSARRGRGHRHPVWSSLTRGAVATRRANTPVLSVSVVLMSEWKEEGPGPRGKQSREERHAKAKWGGRLRRVRRLPPLVLMLWWSELTVTDLGFRDCSAAYHGIRLRWKCVFPGLSGKRKCVFLYGNGHTARKEIQSRSLKRQIHWARLNP